MKIYDISQEVFSSMVYPGDPSPIYKRISSIEKGDAYNLCELELCTHSGTHIDAPSHFLKEGKTIDEINLEACVGPSTVLEFSGEVGAKELLPYQGKVKERLLLKGEITLTAEGAKALLEMNVRLIGVEGLTVGEVEAPAEVHRILLEREVVILEGLILTEVTEGEYFLSALPLKLGGVDGAPVRAVLVES